MKERIVCVCLCVSGKREGREWIDQVGKRNGRGGERVAGDNLI